ncbi:MAG: glycosyltransferase [Bacteroidetes bacterium]|nr:glycosyltransferase [Bacteroidota bacterium]
MPDVVFSLTGDVRRNSRAIKQLRALTDLGCSVEVLALGEPANVDWMPGVRLHLLERPPGGGLPFFWSAHRAMAQAARSIPARVYHASDLYTLPAMFLAARRHDARLVYDARECYPHVASTAGRPHVRLFWHLLERFFARRADAVFTVSTSIAERMASAYGIPPPMLLHNVPPRQRVTPSTYLRDQTGVADDTCLLLHQGSVQKDRGCEHLVDAMRDVDGAVLVFLGGGPRKPELQQHVTREGLGDRVRFLDPVPPDDLLPVTASADVGITLLEDTCLNHRFALPNKLFEYLMAGLPVLASDLPEIRSVVDGHEVGLLVDPSDRRALVDALRRLVRDASARRRWAANAPSVFETFSWEAASQRLQRTYSDLLSSSSA